MQKDSLKVQYLDETYENLAALGKDEEKKNTVFLVRHKQSGKIYVKKYIDRSLVRIYEKLRLIEDCHLEKIYDYAADETKGIVILEYISGMTLQEYIEEKGILTKHDACHIIEELLGILKKVHEIGIIHRDINPNNIMLSNDGVWKLIDFNIARQKKEGQYKDTTILGTVGYAAPEQFGFLQTDERTDIYAIGVLWNVLLTGCFPTEKCYSVFPVSAMIRQCIEMDQEKRYRNAEELLKDIQRNDNKSESKKGLLSWLPGFRTGCVWKNAIASIGYFAMILCTSSFIEECSANWWACVLETIAVFLYIWGATLAAANIGYWDRRISVFRKLPKVIRILLRFLMWFVLFLAGVMLENYVKYDLLGMVRK